MIEEQIAEAADALARIQLGLNKKSEDEKDDKMPAMFMQITEVFNEELMEQFRKITVNMAQKFGLKDLSPKTLARIAEKIKDEAIDGNIQSLSTLSQNEEILRFAEKEIIKYDTVRNENQEESNVKETLKNDDNANKDVNKKFEELTKVTETQNQVHNLFVGMTADNVSEVRGKIIKIVNSKEREEEYQKFMESAKEIAKTGTSEQKAQTMAEIRRKEVQRQRNKIPPEERKQKRNQVNAVLFEYLVLFENEGFNKFDYCRNEFEEFIATELAFTNEEVLKLTELINNSKTLQDLKDIVLDKMISLKKELPNVSLNEENFRKIILEVARNKTKNIQQEKGIRNDFSEEEKSIELEKEMIANNGQEKIANLSEYYESLWNGKKNLNEKAGLFENQIDIIDRKLCAKYAAMFLNNEEDKTRLMSFLSQIEYKEEHGPYDFSILDKINKIDKNFYYLMLRQIGTAAKKTQNPILQQKVEELVEKETVMITPTISKETIIRARQELSPKEQKIKKAAITGILQSFIRDNFHTDKSLEYRKKEFFKYLEKEQALSEEEKVELYNKMSTISTGEEWCDILIDKMQEISSDKGIEYDKEQLLNSARREIRETYSQRMVARAKIVLDDQMYNTFMAFRNDLFKGAPESENRDYNYDFLDLLKQKDSKVYEDLKRTIQLITIKRKDDKKIQRLYDRLESNDRSEEYFIEEAKKEKENTSARIENVINKSKTNRMDTASTKKSTTKTSTDMFGFLVQMYDEKNENEESFERIKNDVFEYIANDPLYSDDKKRDLLGKIINSDRLVLLGNVIADEMVDLVEKRGLPSKTLVANQIVGAAKAKTQTKNISERENINKRAILQSRLYAKIFLEPEDRKEVIGLFEKMSSSSKNEIYDFSILDKVKEVDQDFYYTMIRAVGTMSKMQDDNVLKEKYNELVAKELMEKGYNNLEDSEKTDVYAKIVLDDGIYNRYKNLESEIINGSVDGMYDEELIKYIKRVEPRIYSTLINQIKIAAKDRNDQGLLDLADKFDKDSAKREENIDDNKTSDKKSILTVQNLTVDEIMMTHSDGFDMFDSQHRNGQKLGDTGEER